jgi:small conductance mechanosensitive channel
MNMWLIGRIIGVLVVTIIAYFVLRIIINKATKPLTYRLKESLLNVVRFFLFYGVFFLVVAAALNVAGFNITALLGAAGVFGVAVGFAAQTTFSNVISGIFLMIEQSYSVGDLIAFEDARGRVTELGLLSTSLKTIDNKVIRVPNERLIKANITNLSLMKERRLTFRISAYKTADAAKVQELITAAWQSTPQAIKERPVGISYVAVSADMLGFTADLWVKTPDVIATQSSYIEQCYKQSQERGINCYVSYQA